MKSITRFFRAICVLAATAALGAQAAPSASYALSFTSDSAGRKATMHMDGEVLGGKLRLSINTDKTGAPVQIIMIIDSAAATMTSIMPAQSMAMVTSTTGFAGAAMQPYTMELSGEPKVTTVDLGPGEAILGHATHHYRRTFAYTTKIAIGDMTCTKVTNQATEVWTTSEISAPDLTAAMQWMSAAGTQRQYAQQLQALQNSGIHGVVLRQVGTSTPSSGGDTSAVHFTWEVTGLKQGAVDPADFDVPQGYQVMDTREMMANMDPDVLRNAMAGVQAKLKETLGKTLCAGAEVHSP